MSRCLRVAALILAGALLLAGSARAEEPRGASAEAPAQGRIGSAQAASSHPRLIVTPRDLVRLGNLARDFDARWVRLITWATEDRREEAIPAEGPGLALVSLILRPTRPDQARRLALRALDCASSVTSQTPTPDPGPALAGVQAVALVLDWAWADLPAEARARLAQWLVAQARALEGRGGGCFDLAATQGLAACAVAGAAALGDAPGAEAVLEKALEERWRQGLLPCLTQAGQGGAWFEGDPLGAEAGYNLALFASAMRTHLGRDITAAVPWFQDRLSYLCFALRPDVATGPGGIWRLVAPTGEGPTRPQEAWEDLRLQMMCLLHLRPRDKAAGWARTMVLERDVAAFWQEHRLAWGLLWMETEGRLDPLASAPLSYLAPGTGTAFLRSDWSRLATWMVFRAGPHYAGAQHLDAGGLSLYRTGPLMPPGGVYDGRLSDQALNYRIRSAAHNTVLIFDPREYSWYDLGAGVKPRGTYANDGGQRAWSLFDAKGQPTRSAPWTATGWEGGEGAWSPNREIYDAARVETLEEYRRFTYLRADLTPAYRGSSAKAERVVRHVFHLRRSGPQDPLASEVVVVADDVTVARDDLVAAFVCHLPAEPRVEGRLEEVGPGRKRGQAARVATGSGSSRLEVLCLVPGKPQVEVIGGAGQAAAWVDGANHPPAEGQTMAAPWRVVFSDPRPQGRHRVMLHCLLPASAEAPPASPIQALESPDPLVKGLIVEDAGWPRVLALRLAGGDPGQPLVYAYPAGRSRHLVAGLQGGQGYSVKVEAEQITITPGGQLQASPGGLLFFNIDPGG